MLYLSESIINKPIMSLRTGQEIGQTINPLINPNNLSILGFYSKNKHSNKLAILLYQDIREFSKAGFIVNDHDSLSDPADLVRINKIIQLNFYLIGKPVITVSKEKIGKVNNYAVEMNLMSIIKLYVSQPLIKSLSGGNLSVDRSQIEEVTDRKIIIKDLLATNPITASAFSIG